MRTIHLTQREARLLRDNLTTNSQGFDFLDLRRLDHLANTLTDIQGEYGEKMAELAREEKKVRKQFVRNQISQEDADKAILRIQYEVEDLNEEADGVEVELRVEDGDWRLINDKLSAVDQWLGRDDLRTVIIGMVEAVQNAESNMDSDTVTPFKKRGDSA